jgi:hypothetical protein
MSGELDRVITQGAAQAQLRFDDGRFALRSFQPRASSVRNVQALVVYSALYRRYPVSCALSVVRRFAVDLGGIDNCDGDRHL